MPNTFFPVFYPILLIYYRFISMTDDSGICYPRTNKLVWEIMTLPESIKYELNYSWVSKNQLLYIVLFTTGLYIKV